MIWLVCKDYLFFCSNRPQKELVVHIQLFLNVPIIIVTAFFLCTTFPHEFHMFTKTQSLTWQET
jgi:hypothetical protein